MARTPKRSSELLSPRAIEDGFPFEEVSEVAELESWRKEIHRPIYHIHKWWAQRLGSVFRAALIAAANPTGADVMDLFYGSPSFSRLVVLDPFMGSGTTIGEAHKLGFTAIGQDINPVAYRSVRTALGPLDRQNLQHLFRRLQHSVRPYLEELYRAEDNQGNPCTALYFFWVKVAQCPSCAAAVDLFSNYVFASHAYPKKHPKAHVVCAECSGIFHARYNSTEEVCPHCSHRFNPQHGPAKRATATCRNCETDFQIAKTLRATGNPPSHRMYAKLVLKEDGTKEYVAVTPRDSERFDTAKKQLGMLRPPLPRVKIPEGYNTRQILNYGYTCWHELFNERQLLALSMLAQGIQDLPDSPEREALAVLFSGVLEFNNMFASYKGEGTGAVRHMFSHHVLKPERTPIEANVWGTPKSSGSFSTLYKTRLLRALDYRESPFELKLEVRNGTKRSQKVFPTRRTLGGNIRTPSMDAPPEAGGIYLACGSSARIDLADQSVDLVVTDPPFFDNVHYSELADFFFVWQELYFGHSRTEALSTRHEEEVQDIDGGSFSRKLQAVFRECARVLRPGGLLVFSYHHSREDGWNAVADAVLDAGFSFVQSQPVKSEMSVAAPKNLAREPIDLDILLVCRRREEDSRAEVPVEDAVIHAEALAATKVKRFSAYGRRLSRNDVLVVLVSQLLVELSAGREAGTVQSAMMDIMPTIRTIVEKLWSSQNSTAGRSPLQSRSEVHQSSLFGDST